LAGGGNDAQGAEETMTEQQLHLFNAIGLAYLAVFAFFTRPTVRRLVGALAGGAVVGVLVLGIIDLGDRAGWWHMVLTWEPYFLTLFVMDCVLFCAAIYLVTWRVARRFGGRGLVVVVLIAAVIGPPRDHWYMAHFPEWGAYAPGIAPVLAISVTYALMIVVGHAVMRLVAGPARGDALAARPGKPRSGPAGTSTA
jgi:hypothetical protein